MWVMQRYLTMIFHHYQIFIINYQFKTYQGLRRGQSLFFLICFKGEVCRAGMDYICWISEYISSSDVSRPVSPTHTVVCCWTGPWISHCWRNCCRLIFFKSALISKQWELTQSWRSTHTRCFGYARHIFFLSLITPALWPTHKQTPAYAPQPNFHIYLFFLLLHCLFLSCPYRMKCTHTHTHPQRARHSNAGWMTATLFKEFSHMWRQVLSQFTHS